jgi:hypothetical protein
VAFKIFDVALVGAFAQHAGTKQQSAFPQHFVHVNRLQAGVAISPSVVPLLAG